jgi:hypothetical protein
MAKITTQTTMHREGFFIVFYDKILMIYYSIIKPRRNIKKLDVEKYTVR